APDHAAEPAATNGRPPAEAEVDTSFMEHLRALEREAPGLVQDVLGLFLEDVPGQLAALQEALLEGDPQRLSEGAHKLKGTTATMGMQRISGLAAELEARTRQGTMEGSEELVRAITTEYELVRPLLVSVQAHGLSVQN
ncbi:MAG TPA: Hpt domain-containing protein, partial [bacterium]|nr:Hpt domain-containing protein [bacterium]